VLSRSHRRLGRAHVPTRGVPFTIGAGATCVGSFRLLGARGHVSVVGTEMGFTTVPDDVYKLLGKYYKTVVDFRNPEFTTAQKARTSSSRSPRCQSTRRRPAAILLAELRQAARALRGLKRHFDKKGLSGS